MDERSIQEQLYPDMACFGCGPSNTKGLLLRSYPADGFVRATFTPWPEHDNGLGYLNGGIISTIMDCHSAAAVILEGVTRGWLAESADLPYVTSGIDVRYLRPSPLVEPSELRAVLTAADEEQMTAEVELWWDGKVRATATAVWKRWRPRPA